MRKGSSSMAAILGSFAEIADGASRNSTSSAGTSAAQMLPRVLDFVLPGYGMISKSILDFLGIDINLLLYVALGLLAFVQTRRLLNSTTSLLLDRLTYKFTFDNETATYSQFMEWASKQGLGLAARNVRVDIKDPDFNTIMDLKDFDPLSNDTVRSLPRKVKVMPSYQGHWFLYKKGLYRFVHGKREKKEGQDVIEASVSCVSLSSQPLKTLFNDMLQVAHEEEISKTTIYWPSSKQRRMNEWRRPWTKIGTRQSRPVRTVILDRTLKSRVLSDIAEFLDKDTASWYSDRGLPYRRGYMFVGAPGTGKTSLSFAIAGVFQLDIYVLSLQDPSITENDLMILFNDLPNRCIVVLEDIDSAGIKNRSITPRSTTPKEKKGDEVATKKSRPKRIPDEDEEDSRISLSGLLNVIDGIASKEGRILVMTTNDLESLDAALIRPGRIDLTIEFRLLSKADAEDLFKLMYQKPRRANVPPDTEKEIAVLDELATRFAEHVPDDTFSPAEIQGYLLTQKHDPKGAVDGLQAWVDEALEKKKLDEEKRKEAEKQKIADAESAKNESAAETDNKAKSEPNEASTEGKA